MRPDMSKVLVERERLGVNGAEVYRRVNRRHFNDVRSFDEAPSHGSMSRKRQYGYYCKQLNENLSPLKRFIESHVGQHWDKVYSEIRAHVRFENAVQQHILQHLWGYVERNPVLNGDGVACYPPTRYRSHQLGLIPLGFDSFFVHPKTGVLSRGKKVVAKRKGHRPNLAGVAKPVNQSGFQEVRVRKGSGGDVFVKDGGVWYLADLRPIPEGFDWGKPVRRTRQERRYDPVGGSTVVEVPYNDEGPKDVLLGRRVGSYHHSSFGRRDDAWYAQVARNEAQRYYGRVDRYCAGKGHQLDTKALRRLGLQNEAA